jgi:membrane protein YqaA with SNARE-associated domain
MLNQDKKNTHSKSLYAVLVAFLFETFLFIPLDLVIAVYAHKNQNRAFVTACMCAFLSTLSAVMAYFIGHFAFHSIGQLILKGPWIKGWFDKLLSLYVNYDFSVVFVGALLPLPIKVVTISSGFFGINLFKFFTAVLIARIIRFNTIAYWSIKYGHKVDKLINGFWFKK